MQPRFCGAFFRLTKNRIRRKRYKKNRTQYFVFDINFCIAYKVLHAYEHMQGGRAPCTHSL